MRILAGSSRATVFSVVDQMPCQLLSRGQTFGKTSARETGYIFRACNSLFNNPVQINLWCSVYSDKCSISLIKNSVDKTDFIVPSNIFTFILCRFLFIDFFFSMVWSDYIMARRFSTLNQGTVGPCDMNQIRFTSERKYCSRPSTL